MLVVQGWSRVTLWWQSIKTDLVFKWVYIYQTQMLGSNSISHKHIRKVRGGFHWTILSTMGTSAGYNCHIQNIGWWYNWGWKEDNFRFILCILRVVMINVCRTKCAWNLKLSNIQELLLNWLDKWVKQKLPWRFPDQRLNLLLLPVTCLHISKEWSVTQINVLCKCS